jgi:hypothetical protein
MRRSTTAASPDDLERVPIQVALHPVRPSLGLAQPKHVAVEAALRLEIIGHNADPARPAKPRLYRLPA